MWNPSQIADFILAGLSDADTAKAIGRAEPPEETRPFSNLEVVSSEFEGENGVVSSSITERLTTLRLITTTTQPHLSANPYAALDTILHRQVDEINALARNKPANSGIVDLYVRSVTDYDTDGAQAKEQGAWAAINIVVRHR